MLKLNQCRSWELFFTQKLCNLTTTIKFEILINQIIISNVLNYLNENFDVTLIGTIIIVLTLTIIFHCFTLKTTLVKSQIK